MALTLSTTPSGVELRKWQHEALTTIINRATKGQDTFTVIATMGSGKTFLQGAVAHWALSNEKVDLIVNIVPSDKLRETNASEFRKHFGVRLGTNITAPVSPWSNGYVTTYHALARPKTAAKLISNLKGRRILLIADEVHHGADHEEAAWGNALSNLKERSALTLLLSGTLWRSDECCIAGVEYVPHPDSPQFSVPKTDFDYTLKQATDDEVVTPVYFTEVSGSVSISVETDDEESVDEKLTVGKYSDVVVAEKSYRHLVNPKGGFVRDLLTKANNGLVHKVWQHIANGSGAIPPGGLVVASDTKAAEAIALILEKITGEAPYVVHSGRPGSKTLIDYFASNDTESKWIVSVGMISEGVDIPRIKVIAYLTTARTELIFHQIVGRAMRVRTHSGIRVNEDADVFLPATPKLHGHVTRFTEAQGNPARASAPIELEVKDVEEKEVVVKAKYEEILTESHATGVESFDIRGNEVKRKLSEMIVDALDQLQVFIAKTV